MDIDILDDGTVVVTVIDAHGNKVVTEYGCVQEMQEEERERADAGYYEPYW